MKRQFQKFMLSQRGVAAVEFGLVLPVILLIYTGSLVAFDSYRGYRAVSMSANTVADLTSRYALITNDEVDFLQATGVAMLDKYANDNSYSIVMTSIESDDDGDLSVGWSHATDDGTALEDGDIDDLSLPEIPEGESVIMVTTAVSFTPMFESANITVHKTAIRNPRFVPVVTYE